MIDKSDSKDLVRELERQNPQVATAFRKFRRRGQPVVVQREARDYSRQDISRRMHILSDRASLMRAVPRAMVYSAASNAPLKMAVILVLIALSAVGVFVAPRASAFLRTNWQTFLLPLAGLLLGAAVVILISRFNATPLGGVKPPDPSSADPLQELKDLAERSFARLRTSYKLQLWECGNRRLHLRGADSLVDYHGD